MANTVNITVRVTDNTRTGLAAVNQSLRDLRARTLAAGASGGVLHTAFTRLGAAANTLRGHLTRSAESGTAFGGVLGRMRSALGSVGEAFNRSRLAGVSFASVLGNLRSGLGRATSAMGDHKKWVALVAAGWLALGPAAGALAAALTVGLGAAFIGLGALALKGDAQVKAAFAGLKSTVTSTVRDAAQPLKPFLIDGMNQLAEAAKRAGPALRSAFTAAGPLIHPLVAGLTDLGKNAMPGLLAALSRARPAMEGFSTALGSVGAGVGEMFQKMTADPQALGRIWVVAGDGLKTLLSSLGELMHTAASSSTTLALLAAVFGTVNAAVGAVTLSIKGLDKATLGVFDGLKAQTSTSVMSLGELNKALEENQKKIEAVHKQKLGPASQILLDPLLKERAALEAQVAEASKKAAAATGNEAAAITKLMAAMTALNDKVRGSLDATSAMEASIDAAATGALKHAAALRMVGGQLDLNSGKSREAYGLLSDLAAKTEAAAKAARDGGQSWSQVNAVWSRGRTQLLAAAQAMGLTKEQAAGLAAQILKTPDKTVRIRMDKADATAGLNAFNAAVRRSPGSKSVTLKTLSAAAEKLLSSFGYQVRHLPDGSVTVSARTGGALSGIKNVRGAVDGLHSKTITITARYVNSLARAGQSVHDAVGATGGLFTGTRFKHGYASGGKVVGPGTGTSDEVFAPWLSNGEFVMKKSAVDRYGERFLQLLNAGRLDMPTFSAGGPVATSAPAGGGRSGGGGGGRVLQVNLVLDGKVAARALIDPLRGEIRSLSGGNVQAALGR